MSTIVNDLVSHLQCGEAISANDAVYIDSSDGKIYKFTPTDDTQVFAGIAKEAGVLNDFIRVVQSGRVKGFTGLTPGQFVYASTTVPGSFQLVEPVASQKVILGIAKSATELTINGGLGIKPGGDGSGGGLDAFYIEDMEALADVADFATGNNASFLGGGTLQGTLAVESVSPISGLKSLKYTQAAGSLNDYFASELIEIDPKQQNNTSGMTLYFTYDGNDNDMKFVVWDVTNGVELSNQVSFVKKASSATRYSLSFYVPASCTQIRWGAQVLVENIGAELVVDDVEMSTDPFVEGELTNMTDWAPFTPTGSWTTNTVYSGRWKRVGDSAKIRIKVDTLGAPNSADLKLDVSSLGQIDFSSFPEVTNDVVFHVGGGFAINSGVSRHPVNVIISKTTGDITIQRFRTVPGTNPAEIDQLSVTSTGPFAFGTGDGVDVTFEVPIKGWTASTSHILTPSDTFSTDTAPLTYAPSSQYTLATLANAPIGTYITFTYAANTNTRTQTTTRPTQTDADMNQNGIRIFTRAFNAASTAAQPAAIAIQIGKGMKGFSVDGYSQGKATGGGLTLSTALTLQSGSIMYGLTFKDYSEATGVLVLDAGLSPYGSETGRSFLAENSGAVPNGYFTINAGKTLPLLAVPTPQVAYLKDAKPSGTPGGTATAGSWLTRTLNTVEGDGSIVSLSANQFTLGPGRYMIEASAPAYGVNLHQIRIRNITDSLDAIIGSSEFSELAGTNSHDQTRSWAVGTLTITSPKTFELQHQSGSTFATLGFGLATSFGGPEIYSQVKITKLA